MTESEAKRGLHIAAVIMQAIGLCRYESTLQCRRFYPPTDDDCVNCIEKWLIMKARGGCGKHTNADRIRSMSDEDLANNRLYIYCPECNQAAFLGKHFGPPYGIPDEKLFKFRQFLDDHAFCTGVKLCEECGDRSMEFTITGVELPGGVEFV